MNDHTLEVHTSDHRIFRAHRGDDLDPYDIDGIHFLLQGSAWFIRYEDPERPLTEFKAQVGSKQDTCALELRHGESIRIFAGDSIMLQDRRTPSVRLSVKVAT